MVTLLDSLDHTPVELNFGTSGLRGLVREMTDLECYINTRGFISFLRKSENLTEDAVFYLGGDLRDSTPRIMTSVYQAIADAGHRAVNLGALPTPALLYYALLEQSPSIMVTGSHIPSDRNGIKFNKISGEVLKDDEAAIKEAVACVRSEIYGAQFDSAQFSPDGMLKKPTAIPEVTDNGVSAFMDRYTSVFSPTLLTGKHIVVYQHSSVARDIFVELFERLGANVTAVGRSETFVPIDTENVTPVDKAYFQHLATEFPDAFAIVSADGDADRPFVVDEKGLFHRGDVLGALVADWLGVDFAAVPISSSDAVTQYLAQRSIAMTNTKIGSPYVVVAMQQAVSEGKRRVAGWEVNGGFLLGSDFDAASGTLKALPSRDSFLPILAILASSIESEAPLSEMFARLPARYTSAGLVDNFPVTMSKQILHSFSLTSEATKKSLQAFFRAEEGFSDITDFNSLDGIRIYFSNGDIAHLRPSGNAPQLRMYSVADSQERADEIVSLAIAEPDGIIRSIEKSLS